MSRRPPAAEEAPAPEGATHIFSPETKKIEPVEPEVVPAADGGKHPAQQPNDLNEAYKAYKNDPSTEDSFAKALLDYITRLTWKLVPKGYLSEATIQDVIGQSAQEVWQQLPAYDPSKSKLTTLGYQIVERNIKDTYRKNSNKQEEGYTEGVDSEHQGEESQGIPPASGTTGGPKNAPPTMGIDFIADNLVSKLDVVSQAIFKMKTEYGYSDAEIAKRLGHDDIRWASNKWAYIQTKLRELATPLYKYNPVTRKMEKNK